MKKNKTLKVSIVMGSQSDYKTMNLAKKILKKIGVSFETRIISAHRTPKRMYDYASSAEKNNIGVIIAGAGGSAHLPGMISAITSLPVLGVPIESKKLKGENRPINPELARAIVLAALGVVDHVILFSEDTPLNTILAIKPDLIVKGGDYDAALSDPTDKRYIVGKNEAEVWGGSAQTIPLVEGYSTTGLLAKR